jgi:hypothetical protein
LGRTSQGTQTRPRPWYRFDSGFPDQDTVQDLGDAFGAAGPLVLVVLFCDACATYSQKTRDFETVEGRYSALARRVYADAPTVKSIIARAAEVGLVESLDSDAQRYTVRLTQWAKWNAKDPTAASRQRKSRAKRASESADGAWDGTFPE